MDAGIDECYRRPSEFDLTVIGHQANENGAALHRTLQQLGFLLRHAEIDIELVRLRDGRQQTGFGGCSVTIATAACRERLSQSGSLWVDAASFKTQYTHSLDF